MEVMMAEEEKPPEEHKEEKKKKKFEIKSEKIQQAKEFIGNRGVEVASGCLMVIGLILSFFFMRIGGILVGLAVGLCFYDGIRAYFVKLSDYYVAQGLFKTLMIIGMALYLLMIAPFFLIAIVVGYGLAALCHWGLDKE